MTGKVTDPLARGDTVLPFGHSPTSPQPRKRPHTLTGGGRFCCPEVP
jgi:hypothetical protein